MSVKKDDKSKTAELTKEEMRKALDEYVDSLVEQIDEKNTKASEASLSKSDNCEDEEMEKKTTSKKAVVKADAEEDDKTEEEIDEEEEAEDSYKSYKKGFMDAIKRMKEKNTKKSLKADENERDTSSIIEKSIATLTDKISSLSETVEKLSKSPASNSRKSLRGFDVIKKSKHESDEVDIDNYEDKNSSADTMLKSRAARGRIANLMFHEGLLKSDPRNGVQITAQHIAEYESSGRISDPRIMSMVQGMVRDQQHKGLV